MIICSYSNAVEIGTGSSTWAFASSSCEGAASVENGFTHGEIVATVFLFLIFITLVYRFVFEWIHGIRVRPANKV